MPVENISHYKVLRQVSDGARGRVYQAEDTTLRRQVALKFLPRELTGDPEASRRFIREARATSNIDHPNICTIHEIGETREGALFIAMTWYEGQTLKERLAGEKLSTVQALEFAVMITSGLVRAHENEVVHRDIKPANIIITERDEVKIVDFGLARLLTQARMTNQGTVLGTAAYMSPEQARGDDAEMASDIWSTGVVLYEMLTGNLPFHGDHEVALIYSVLNTAPAPMDLDTCPEGCQCQRIIKRCLEKAAEKRYAAAADLFLELEGALEIAREHERRQRPPIWGVGLRERFRHWRRAVAAVGVAAVLALAVTQAPASFRRFLPFVVTDQPHGVAVLPFSFAGAIGDDQAMANGLSWYLAEVLSRVEHQTDRFWLVPPGRTQELNLKSGADAQRLLGIGITVSGSGRIQEDLITLRLTINDRWQGRQTTHTIEDNLSNLKTWQVDLPLLVTRDLAPQFKPDLFDGHDTSLTNVPAAFASFLTGLGYTHGVDEDSDFDQAVKLFDHAVAQDSSYACAVTALGYATWKNSAGHDTEGLARAERQLRRATALNSGSPQPWTCLGTILRRREDTEQARICFDEALALDPHNMVALRGLWKMERAVGNDAGARIYLDRALVARPNYFQTIKESGVVDYYRGDFVAAEAGFRRLVELTPQQHTAYDLLGAALFAQDKNAEAEIMFENSLAIEPSYLAYSNLAVLYFYSGRLHDTIEMSHKALALDDTDYSGWRTLAEAFRWTPGMRDSCEATYRRCVAMVVKKLAESKVDGSAGDPVLRSDLATFYVSLEEYDAARVLLDELEKESHLEIPVMFNLASAYESMQERDRALTWLERAVAADLSLAQVEHYPGLRNLRSHPRFQALRKKYEDQ